MRVRDLIEMARRLPEDAEVYVRFRDGSVLPACWLVEAHLVDTGNRLDRDGTKIESAKLCLVEIA